MATFTKTEVKMVVIPLTIMILLSVVSLGFGAGSIDQLLNGSSELNTGKDISQFQLGQAEIIVDQTYDRYDFPIFNLDKLDEVENFIFTRFQSKEAFGNFSDQSLRSVASNLTIGINQKARISNDQISSETILKSLRYSDSHENLDELQGFGFNLGDTNVLFVGLFIGIITLGIIGAFEVFGSSFDIPNYVISVSTYFLIWGAVSVVSLDFFTEIPIFGGLIYFGLTLMYVLGVLMTTEIL